MSSFIYIYQLEKGKFKDYIKEKKALVDSFHQKKCTEVEDYQKVWEKMNQENILLEEKFKMKQITILSRDDYFVEETQEEGSERIDYCLYYLMDPDTLTSIIKEKIKMSFGEKSEGYMYPANSKPSYFLRNLVPLLLSLDKDHFDYMVEVS